MIVKIINYGNWFYCYGDDALIISYLMGYKLFSNKRTWDDMVGFKDPFRVCDKLTFYNINFSLIFDSRDVSSNFNRKKEFENNQYLNILKRAEEYFGINKYSNRIIDDSENKIVYHESGSNYIRAGKSVTIKNHTSNEIEIYNIVESKYHYEIRYGDSTSMYSPGHFTDVRVYDKTPDITKDEISADSKFAKKLFGHTVGYKFEFNDELFEVINVSNYEE